ncbi:MAG: DUF1566 domain-containing protein [Marinilabiliaceae bacterium]|nr:DUF1566 domain-containing protein [Marinilabiliaceae bacterium]
MSYQAVVRNSSDALVTNTQIGMQISILQGSASGTVVYTETQTPTTNANGLVSIEIGGSAAFDAIDWSAGSYFIKTETDPAGGTNYSITGTSQLLSVPYALHAKTAETLTGGITESQISDLGTYIETETDPTVTKYSVGEFAQGGIVFWVDETGQHGLVAAKEDQSTGVRWYAGTFGVTRATGDGPFSGELNTAIIITSQVSIGDDGSDYAAQICNDLQVTEGGKTYGDWYLPSKKELDLMYQNKATIDATAVANGGSGFVSTYYWSSTEASSTNAWERSFFDGYQTNYSKTNVIRVRAVRAF